MDEDLKILSAEEVKKTLIDYPGWEYRDDKITREFQFESFGEAVEFIKKLAPFCDKIDHHPDVHIYYKNYIPFKISTALSICGSRLASKSLVEIFTK